MLIFSGLLKTPLRAVFAGKVKVVWKTGLYLGVVCDLLLTNHFLCSLKDKNEKKATNNRRETPKLAQKCKETRKSEPFFKNFLQKVLSVL